MSIQPSETKKRKEAIPANSRNWTEQEVNLLKELDELYRDYRYPNVEISKIFTTKTVEQIKNKMKKLKMINEEASSQEVNPQIEEGCDPCDSGNAPVWSGLDELERDSIIEWRRCLKIEIEKDSEVPLPTQKLYKELKKMWDDFKDHNTTLVAKINKFVGTSLLKALSNNYGDRLPNRKMNNENKNKNIKYNSKNKKVEINQRRRYVYARGQDIFRECPRELADVVINDDLAYLAPARQPPAAKEVRTLYKELWGKMGPLDPPYQKNMFQEVFYINTFLQ
jgi:hypothetical protein